MHLWFVVVSLAACRFGFDDRATSDRGDAPSGDALTTCDSTAPFGTPVASGAFGAPVLVPNVNSDAYEGPSWLSLDGCRLYLSSDRAGTNDIYIATRGH